MAFPRLRVALAVCSSASLLPRGRSHPPRRRRRARDVRGVGRLLRPVAADAGGSGSRRRHAAERACATTCAPNGKPGRPRRAAARRQGRFGAGRRRPAGAGALRRAHGVRRHAALSAAEHHRLPVVARLEHRCRTRTRRRATTTRNTRCACRPTCPACSIARCWSSRTGRRAPRSTRAASTASAASSCRNGGCTSARASARRTRSAACSSKDRATRTGRRSAIPTSSSTRSASS